MFARMCVCMYVLIYVCTCTCVCAHVRACAYMCVRTSVRAYAYACMHGRMAFWSGCLPASVCMPERLYACIPAGVAFLAWGLPCGSSQTEGIMGVPAKGCMIDY